MNYKIFTYNLLCLTLPIIANSAWFSYDKLGGSSGGTFLPLDFDKTEIYKLFKEKLDENAPFNIVIDVCSSKYVLAYEEQNGNKYLLTQMDKYAGLY